MNQGPTTKSSIACHDTLTPTGQSVRVSTIRCVPGGADPNQRSEYFFNSTVMGDHETFNIWPFETMVFPVDSSFGLYHEPHATEEEARARHQAVVAMVETSEPGLWQGCGVDLADGMPSMTRQEWEEKQAARVKRWTCCGSPHEFHLSGCVHEKCCDATTARERLKYSCPAQDRSGHAFAALTGRCIFCHLTREDCGIDPKE